MAHRDKTSIPVHRAGQTRRPAEVHGLPGWPGHQITKLESRPLRGEKWKYVFFADLECDLAARSTSPSCPSSASACHTLKVLGSYPTGPHIGTMG
jgi:chorismate mutase/prephenate dehydratase